MGNSEVKVTLAPGNEVTLATDNPNIDELVKAIVKIKDSLDLDEIKISCEKDSFDAASFTEVIRESCKDFLDSIKLEKESYETVLSALENKNSERAAPDEDG